MGFVLTIIYVLAYYLTPAILFGPLAQFRVQLILGLVLLIISLPRFARSFALKSSQTLAVSGLATAVFLSILFGASWLGGAVQGFISFLPNALVYFFVCAQFNTRGGLHAVALPLMVVCLFVTAHGAYDVYRAVPDADRRLPEL